MKSAYAFRIRISGRVQGVGFRYSAVQAARRAGVTGWVRNEWDGSVTAVCEGSAEATRKFIGWCGKGPDHSHVVSAEVSEIPYQGVYTGFKIEY